MGRFSVKLNPGVGVDKGCEDLAADCAGALRPGAASHLAETPFLEGFLQVGMGIRGD